MENVVEQLCLFDLDTKFGRMSPERSPPQKAKTSVRCLKKLYELRTADFQFLDLCTGAGNLLGVSWEIDSPSLGEFWTLNTGPAPHNGGDVSTLSQILQEQVPLKYYLSKAACLGILRRAEVRGRDLPEILRRALQVQAGIDVPIIQEKTEEKQDCMIPWDVQSRRIYDDSSAWSSLYSGEGGGHGYVKTNPEKPLAFHINQREETIDLGGVSGALMATSNMQMQTFIAEAPTAFACNQRDEVRYLHDVAGALGAQPGMKQQTFVAAGFCAGASPTAGNIGFQEEVSPTLKAAESGTNMVPSILCPNDQGGKQMSCTADISGTLRAQEHGHQPLLFENHGIDSRYTGPHTVAPTMSARYGTGGNNVPLVGAPIAFSLDSKESNSMKSANPHSGCRETDLARTIDTANPDPSKNQCGIAIFQEAICIAGNTIDRQPKNGGNGFGYQADLAYTLTAMDKHAVYSRQRSDQFSEECQVASTQSTRQNKDATDLICYGQTQHANYKEGVSTLRASGGDSGGGSENLITSRNLIRRLTPLECERLQGYADGWTDIPGASDSARYKALGNSVAIPCVEYVMRGIAHFLSQGA